MAKIRIVLEAEEKRELNKRLRDRPLTWDAGVVAPWRKQQVSRRPVYNACGPPTTSSRI